MHSFEAGVVNLFYDGMLLWCFRMQCHGLVELLLLRTWCLSRDRMFKQRTHKHTNGCVNDVIARGPSIIWRLIMHVLNFAYCCILSKLGSSTRFTTECLSGGVGCNAMGLLCCRYCGSGVFQKIECSNNEPVGTTTAASTTSLRGAFVLKSRSRPLYLARIGQCMFLTLRIVAFFRSWSSAVVDTSIKNMMNNTKTSDGIVHQLGWTW